MWISKKLFNQRLMKEPWKLYNTRKIIISYTLDVPATRQCSSSLQSSLQSSVAISHKNQHILNTFFWLILSFLIFAAPSLTILHRGMFSAFTLLISSKIFLFFSFSSFFFLVFQLSEGLSYVRDVSDSWRNIVALKHSKHGTFDCKL